MARDILAHTRLQSFSAQHPQGVIDRLKRCGPFRPSLAYLDRGSEDGSNRDNASQLVRCHGGQSHGCDTATRTTVRIAAELTGGDPGLQIRRQRLCGECKDTLSGTVWRCSELVNHPLRHVQLRIFLTHCEHVGNGLPPFTRLKYLRQPVSHLWSEQAEPHLANLGSWGRELQKIL